MAGQEEKSGMKIADKPVLGIDLGTTTTYTNIQMIHTTDPSIVLTAEGDRCLKSVVGFGEPVKYGDAALEMKHRPKKNKPYQVIEQAKLLIGTKSEEISPEKRKAFEKVFDVPIVYKDGQSPLFKITTNGKEDLKRPEEIAAMLLTQVIKNVHRAYPEFEGMGFNAVVTVPARFNTNQRQATKDACEIAGLNVKRIINEPTSALLNAIHTKRIPAVTTGEHKVLVVDFGGGTLDLSLASSLPDNLIEIIKTDGDTMLGGHDVTNAIAWDLAHKWAADPENKEHNLSAEALMSNQKNRSKLTYQAESIKKQINAPNASSADVEIVGLGDAAAEWNIEYRYNDFVKVFKDIGDKIMALFDKLMRESKTEVSSLDYILLVGGSCRIRDIKTRLSTRIDSKKIIEAASLDETVSLGAVQMCSQLVFPDKGDNPLVLDVTPSAIGIETEGQFMTEMISAGKIIPHSYKQTFTNGQDGQTMANVVVLEGESKLSKNCKTIGQFNIEITPGRRNTSQIEVEYFIDENSMLTVKARDLKLNKPVNISITSSNRLSTEELEQLKTRNEANKAEEEKIYNLLMSKTQLNNTLDQIETQLEAKTDLPDKDAIKEKLDSLRSELKQYNASNVSGLDSDFFSKKSEELMKDQAIMGLLSEAAAAQGGMPGGMPGMGGMPGADVTPNVEEAE